MNLTRTGKCMKILRQRSVTHTTDGPSAPGARRRSGPVPGRLMGLVGLSRGCFELPLAARCVFLATPWSFFCPAGFEPLFFLALRAGFFLAPRVRDRSALARPRSLRPETPPAATELRRPAVGAPRCSPQAAPATPHRGAPTRCPQPPEPWSLAPPGRIEDAPPSAPTPSTK